MTDALYYEQEQNIHCTQCTLNPISLFVSIVSFFCLSLSLSTPSPNRPIQLDTELHHLLAAMADSGPTPAHQSKMTSAALLCRKVAIRHPALFLRQLPQLGWLLRGRAHLTPREFRNKQHKLLFVNSLAILELLQPMVFQESQTNALELCLEPFFDFLKVLRRGWGTQCRIR